MRKKSILPLPRAVAAKKAKGCVWVSSYKTIRRGQISLLAIAEIPCAMAFFWWVSSISPWPWMTLVGLMAVPVLLLRSPASIRDGVRRLQKYVDRENSFVFLQALALLLVSSLAFIFCRWLSTYSLNTAETDELLIGGYFFGVILAYACTELCSVIMHLGSIDIETRENQYVHYLCCTAFVTFVVIYCIANVKPFSFLVGISCATALNMHLYYVIFTEVMFVKKSPLRRVPIFVFALLVICFVVLVYAVVTNSGSDDLSVVPIFLACIFMNILLAMLMMKFRYVFFAPSMFSTMLHLLYIRFVSTARHAFAGFPLLWVNIKEAVLCVDFIHLPEALPNAASVGDGFALRLLLRGCKDEHGADLYTMVSWGVIIIYLPVFIYRWNLKASALLWGPICYALSPIVWGRDETMRSTTARRTSWPLQKILAWLLSGAGVWLLLPLLPYGLQETLPDKFLKLCTNYSAPPIGLRYLLLWAVWVSLSGLLISAYWIRAPHDKVLADPVELREKYSDEDKAEFKGLATSVQRWLNATLAITVLTVWVFALWWALQKWPDQLHNVAWEWVRPLL